MWPLAMIANGILALALTVSSASETIVKDKLRFSIRHAVAVHEQSAYPIHEHPEPDANATAAAIIIFFLCLKLLQLHHSYSSYACLQVWSCNQSTAESTSVTAAKAAVLPVAASCFVSLLYRCSTRAEMSWHRGSLLAPKVRVIAPDGRGCTYTSHQKWKSES